MPDRIDSILSKVLKPIPAPYRPAPKPRTTWAKLKVGDRLELLRAWNRGSLCHYEAGSVFTVTRVTTEGVWFDDGWHWTNPAWTDHFSRVPKTRKRKGSPT